MTWYLDKENFKEMECLWATVMGFYEASKLVRTYKTPQLMKLKELLCLEIDRFFPDESGETVNIPELKKRVVPLLEELVGEAKKLDCQISLDPTRLQRDLYSPWPYSGGMISLYFIEQLRLHDRENKYSERLEVLSEETIDLIIKADAELDNEDPCLDGYFHPLFKLPFALLEIFLEMEIDQLV